MNNDGWFVIKDLNEFINHTRTMIYSSYGSNNNTDESTIDMMISLSDKEQKELDEILTYNESSVIVRSMLKKERSKKTKKIRYLLNAEIYDNIISSLGDRITSNILQSLVKKGLVETGFDTESNDFVFWIKE